MSNQLPAITFNNGISSPFIVDGKPAVFVMDQGQPRIAYLQWDEGYEQLNMRIDCNPCIGHSSASAFIRNNRLSALDKRVMQGVFTLLNEESNWVWRNAAIEVYGENIAITFHAGGEGNKYVVNLNENNGVTSSCREKGLRLRVRDGVKSIWNGIKSGAKVIFGALTGAGRKMLTYDNDDDDF